jgi:hypothetical protein
MRMKPWETALPRVIIDGGKPEINDGRYATKRVVGDLLVVEADIFADSQDALSAVHPTGNCSRPKAQCI